MQVYKATRNGVQVVAVKVFEEHEDRLIQSSRADQHHNSDGSTTSAADNHRPAVAHRDSFKQVQRAEVKPKESSIQLTC